MPSFTHSLNIIGRCTQMQRGAVLKELGVCGGQVPYLLRLCRCPGLTQEELAKALYFNKSTVTRQIAALERQGLVCIIAPDSTEGMSTLTKNRVGLEKMYAKGKQDAEALVRWMQNIKQDESVGTWR